MEIYLIVGLLCAVLSFAIAASKGRSIVLWPLLGIAVGPLAILVLLALPKSEERATAEAIESGELTLCPFCQEAVKASAIKCKHCQSDLSIANQPVDDDRAVHERLQKAIYDCDIEAAKTILNTDLDLSKSPLPFSHSEYAELHGSREMIALIATKAE